jgi:hypothetical protein
MSVAVDVDVVHVRVAAEPAPSAVRGLATANEDILEHLVTLPSPFETPPDDTKR